MADAIHRTTLELRRSIDAVVEGIASSPDWIVKGKASPWSADEARVLADVPRKYWRVAGDTLAEMDAAGKAAVDAVEAALVQAEADRRSDLDRVRTRGAAIINEVAAIKALTPANLAQMNAAFDRLCDVASDMARALIRIAERTQ